MVIQVGSLIVSAPLASVHIPNRYHRCLHIRVESYGARYQRHETHETARAWSLEFPIRVALYL